MYPSTYMPSCYGGVETLYLLTFIFPAHLALQSVLFSAISSPAAEVRRSEHRLGA